MRVLLSTIGSRGDVQPLVALALRLRELGAESRICAPPDFGDWIGGFGIEFVAVGQAVGKASVPGGDMRRVMEDTVAGQFEAIAPAAGGCDILVAGMSLQFALRSIAELRGVPYIYAAWCPITLPSPHHAPPPMPGRVSGDGDNRMFWEQDAKRWNEHWAAAINKHRLAMGLAPVDDVRTHIMTDRPWLAADPTLAPWPETIGLEVFQTGAWMPSDERPLAREIEAFLDAGEPPIYFGFGSMQARQEAGDAMLRAARAVRKRAIVSRGWAGFEVPSDAPDCLSVGETNLQALFARVAAVVHHGGAGTTTTAARAGVPQVVVPQIYDQHYWARRVQELGIGVAHGAGEPQAASLAEALERAMVPDVAGRARAVATSVIRNGFSIAAERLLRGA